MVGKVTDKAVYVHPLEGLAICVYICIHIYIYIYILYIYIYFIFLIGKISHQGYPWSSSDGQIQLVCIYWVAIEIP